MKSHSDPQSLLQHREEIDLYLTINFDSVGSHEILLPNQGWVVFNLRRGEIKLKISQGRMPLDMINLKDSCCTKFEELDRFKEFVKTNSRVYQVRIKGTEIDPVWRFDTQRQEQLRGILDQERLGTIVVEEHPCAVVGTFEVSQETDIDFINLEGLLPNGVFNTLSSVKKSLICREFFLRCIFPTPFQQFHVYLAKALEPSGASINMSKTIFQIDERAFQEFSTISEQITEAETNDFCELAILINRNPKTDFSDANLKNIDFINVNSLSFEIDSKLSHACFLASDLANDLEVESDRVRKRRINGYRQVTLCHKFACELALVLELAWLLRHFLFEIRHRFYNGTYTIATEVASERHLIRSLSDTFDIELTRDRELAFELARYRARYFNLEVDRYLSFAEDHDQEFERIITRAHTRGSDSVSDRAHDLELSLFLARYLDLNLDPYHDLDFALDRALTLILTRAGYLARDLSISLAHTHFHATAQVLISNLVIAHNRACELVNILVEKINFSNANLSNANLSNANVSNVNFSNADLSKANVYRAQFGSNLGISDAEKHNLIQRGAIFDEAPGNPPPTLSPFSKESLPKEMREKLYKYR